MTDSNQKNKLLALLKILTYLPAQMLYYGSAIGAIAVVSGANIPPELTTIASGIGVNILANILERVVNGENISQEEIESLTHEAIQKSDIEQLLTKQDYLAGFGRLIRRLDLLKTAMESGEFELAQQLTEQYSQHQVLLNELRGYLLSIQSELPKFATREQAETIIALLHQYHLHQPNQSQSNSRTIFLSYARNDDESFVRQLYEDLTARGFKVWWDRISMPSRSLTFLQEIRYAISSIERLIVVIGPDAIQSDYVKAEWQHALESCTILTPILRIGDYSILPFELNKQHCIDMREIRAYEEAFAELLNKLEEPEKPLGKLYNIPSLPPHYVARPDVMLKVTQQVLADVNSPTVITSLHHTTALQGMGGIGKSVVATAFARDCSTRRAFYDGVIWLSIGQDIVDVTTKMQLIGRAFSDNLSFYNEFESAKQRLSTIMDDKACLIVLDDVWRLEHAAVFKDILGSRCRLLITTRDGSIVSSLGAQECHVDILDDENAIGLLAQWIDKPANQLPSEAAEVAKECGNLPLALALCGALVRDGDLWTDVRDALLNADLEYIEKQLPNYPFPTVLKAIKISLDALQRESESYVKHYFELGVFPQDVSIPEQTVVTLWTHTNGINESRARRLLINLEKKSLLQLEGIAPHRTVHLHDLHYDYVRAALGNLQGLHQELLAAYKVMCSGQWWLGPNDRYFFQHLVRHLIAVGQNEEAYDLLVGSPKWINSKFRATYNDFSFLNDINYLIEQYSESKTPTNISKLIPLFAAKQIVSFRAKRYTSSDIETMILIGRIEEAEGYARLHPSTKERFNMLLAIYDMEYGRGNTRQELLEECSQLLVRLPNSINDHNLKAHSSYELIRRWSHLNEVTKIQNLVQNLEQDYLLSNLSRVALSKVYSKLGDFKNLRRLFEQTDTELFNVMKYFDEILVPFLSTLPPEEIEDAILLIPDIKSRLRALLSIANWYQENDVEDVFVKVLRRISNDAIELESSDFRTQLLAICVDKWRAIGTRNLSSKYLENAYKLAQLIHDLNTAADALLLVSYDFNAIGEHNQAKELAQTTLMWAGRFDEAHHRVILLSRIIHIFGLLDLKNEANKVKLQLEQELRVIDNKIHYFVAVNGIVEALRRINAIDAARMYLPNLISTAQQIDDEEPRGELQSIVVKHLIAFEMFDDAGEILRQITFPYYHNEAGIALVEGLLLKTNYDDAESLLESLRDKTRTKATRLIIEALHAEHNFTEIEQFILRLPETERDYRYETLAEYLIAGKEYVTAERICRILNREGKRYKLLGKLTRSLAKDKYIEQAETLFSEIQNFRNKKRFEDDKMELPR